MMLDPFLVFEHRRVRLGAVQTATVPRSGRINAARSHAQTAQPASMARTRVDPPVAGWADPSQPFSFLSRLSFYPVFLFIWFFLLPGSRSYPVFCLDPASEAANGRVSWNTPVEVLGRYYPVMFITGYMFLSGFNTYPVY